MGYALDTDETQVVQGSLACEQHEMVCWWCGLCLNFSGPADTDDDDLILVEPHMNPLQEIEISEAGNSSDIDIPLNVAWL